MTKSLKIIEVKSELGAGTRGASLGVDAIKIAALDFGSRFFKKHKSVEVPNENHLLLENTGSPFAKRISGILTMVERVADEVTETLGRNEFPIVLAGDHSTAAGTITGIKKAFPKSKLGVIWIDAHSDMHSPYTTPSGNMHGMPLAMVLDEDNLDAKVNELDQETLNYWYQLKNVGKIAPKISYSDLVLISARDMEKPEENLLKKNKVKLYSTAEVRKRGVERIVIETMQYLDQCDLIYVSFDVDSMDPTASRGTGTPVAQGLTEREAGGLMSRFLAYQKVCCFEIVEVNPTLDRENQMAEHAFEILIKATNAFRNE
ncbi:arginase [Pedobacter cryoconitis]|uniref:Arginase n=1 Tax=Pedobacter cryoconitis TaxID=188932 RepID=A0A327S2K9_9SPHI|nr:arginase [Pedobacter cryoconitis]MBB5619303.1 arginase [Pedobacter cryoconitis]MBB5644598.1 arginase [Pedobacter cryoconitis]RAJ23131.1 arginase [Pedobacter cryoconitis]